MYKKSNVPADYKEMPRYVDEEFSRVERGMSEPDYVVRLAMSYAPPAKFSEGDIVLADGISWNPGSGIGVYCYYSAAWQKLG